MDSRRWAVRPSSFFLAVSFALLWTALPFEQARAQTPPRNVVKILEEEINLLKETIETNNNRIRKLRERLKKQEAASEERMQTIDTLRKRLGRIDVLQKELGKLEARMSTALTGDAAKESARLQMHAQVRMRPEYTQNRTDVNSDKDDQDAFWGHRVRLGGDFGFDHWVRARVTVQEARKFGDTGAGGSGLGMYEAWAELKPPVIPGLRLRGGRMELSYGQERLIGRDDFAVDGRSFDGGLIKWNLKHFVAVDAFFTKVRESEGPGDHDRDFFGVYVQTRAIPFTTLELYYFGLMDTLLQTRQVGDTLQELEFDTTIHTAGARIEALFFGALRVDAELALQFGNRTDSIDPHKELSHYAMAAYAEIGYQIPVWSHPTVTGFFAWASGDANPIDDKSRGFQSLFPTRHSFLGSMDMFAWQNIMDIGGRIELTPPMGFGFSAAVHYLTLAQSRGELAGLGAGYTPSVDSNRKELGKNIGLELDLLLSWAPVDMLQLQLGYSVFLPGEVLDETPVAGTDFVKGLGFGTDTAHWAYFQALVRY